MDIKKNICSSVFASGSLFLIYAILKSKKDPTKTIHFQKTGTEEIACDEDKNKNNIESNVTKLETAIEEQKDLPEPEQRERRNSRITPIIGIVATVIALTSYLLKLSRGIMEIWELQGIVYLLGCGLYCVVIASAILMLIDILAFIFSDLQRYNVLQGLSCKIFDTKADSMYATLISDYKICIWILILEILALTSLQIIYMEDKEKVCMALVCGSVAISLFCAFVYNCKKKTVSIAPLLCGVLKFVIFAVISLAIVLSFYSNDTIRINASYAQDGFVNVSLSSRYTSDYGNLNIAIVDENGNSIYNEDIEESECLIAYKTKEDMLKVDNRPIEEESLTRKEYHWGYSLNLCDVKSIRESHQYTCVITLAYDDQTLILSNQFFYTREFFFASSSEEGNIKVL